LRKIARLIVNHKLITLIVFIVLTVGAVICVPFVMKKINYNDALYLPKDSQLTLGLDEMYSEFGESGNSSLMIKGISVAEQVELNKEIEKLDNISQVIWIDDLLLSEKITSGTEVPELYKGKKLSEIADEMAPDIEIDDPKFVAMALDLLKMIQNDIPKEDRKSVATIIAYVDDRPSILDKNSRSEYREKYPNYDTDFKNFYNTLRTILLLFKDQIADFSLDGDTIDAIGDQLGGFYKKDARGTHHSLLQIVFKTSDYDLKTQKCIDDIMELLKTKGYEGRFFMIGNAAMTHNAVAVTNETTGKAMMLAGAIVLIILFITTTSYIEPLILLLTMGVAIALNMGTNIIMPNVSYLTNSVASVLQLALTMDYSIYLINRFRLEKRRGLSSNEAMVEAMSNGITAILSACLTTVASFIALMFMRYRLGLDMGIVLAKGVIFSMVSVFFLLPVLVLFFEKLIEKTTHKTFNLSLRKFSRGLLKTRGWVPFLLIAVIVMGGIFQAQNSFTYGQQASMGSEGTPIYQSIVEVEEVFGIQNQGIVLLNESMFDANQNGILDSEIIENAEGVKVEKEGTEKWLNDKYETELAVKLRALPEVRDVQSWSEIEAAGADAMLPDSFKQQFIGQNGGRRVVMFIDLPDEGPETANLVGKINGIVEQVYGEKIKETGRAVYHLGNSMATEEIKNIVTSDYDIISYVSLGLVALIVMLAFKSISIPIILVVVIQGSVYINMAIPFFQGSSIVFVGYMLVSGILLGATIDYAIVLADHYMENRKTMNKYVSMQHALADSVRTILTSSSILTFAGLALTLTSKASPAVGVFGSAIFRGGILSFTLCITLLPQLLVIFDGLIRKTTWRGKHVMVDNRLALITPDVDEAVVIPKTPKKRKGSEEKEQEIINAILAGIAAHDRERESLEEDIHKNSNKYDPAHEVPDYMEVSPRLFDDDDDLVSYMFKKEDKTEQPEENIDGTESKNSQKYNDEDRN
jgi:hypothetical protein